MDGELDTRAAWIDEARAEAREANPLRGYCERVYFVRAGCLIRSGKRKGKKRRRRTLEVELLRFLPSRRCVAVRDLDTPGSTPWLRRSSATRSRPRRTRAGIFSIYFASSKR